MSDLIERKKAIDALDSINCCGWVEDSWEKVCSIIEHVPSAQQDIAEKLYLYKCYITDQEGLQHEVIHVGDIRRVTGWEI